MIPDLLVQFTLGAAYISRLAVSHILEEHKHLFFTRKGKAVCAIFQKATEIMFLKILEIIYVKSLKPNFCIESIQQYFDRKALYLV